MAASMTASGAQAAVLDRRAALACEPMLGRDVRGAVHVVNEAHVDNRRLSRALFAACTYAGRGSGGWMKKT